uniref:ATP synthase subunit a n=1 Tax=Jesogammarus hinumensis TaxID=378308 RepID=A0A891ZKD7_9CRUS|nr:ATP synthase F0 subunit 6 [Jesogammarus hinumensis]QRN71580.1 ATP synthase F0 subunit 6 [Jesogammarus hinumensis]
MTNLFSIFDPSTPNLMSSNWMSMFLMIATTQIYIWALPPSRIMAKKDLYIVLFTEFGSLVKKTPFSMILIFSVFMILGLNNVYGMLPYVFTAPTHLTFSLSMALPIWLAVVFYSTTHNTINFLAHLIPQATPPALIPFLVIIETISNLIRPITLAVRLSANMVAGHLLMTLLSSANSFTPLALTPLLILSQTALTVLECAVAVIQAYVFAVLTTLYLSETTN